MLASFILPALAALSFVSAQQDRCQDAPFEAPACLSSEDAITAICDAAPKQTITITTTTTTLDPVTVETTAQATDQTTVKETTFQKSTVTVTGGRPTTIVTTKTERSTEIATLTTYVPIDAVATGTVAAADASSTCDAGQAISALESLAGGMLATACSCIGYPAQTSTQTVIITAPAVKSTTTEVAGTAPTTTIFQISLSTITETVRPTRYVTKTSTKCTTSTTTLSYAAPTFTRAFGPRAGCENTAEGSGKRLDAGIDTPRKAAQQCRDLCTQDPGCGSVYVQRMSAPGGPHFMCSFGEKHLKAATGLQCGQDKEQFGIAVGFDACSRGTEEL